MKYYQKNRGYTLLEVILVLTLIGIFLIPISTFFITNLKTFHMADDQVEVQYQAQIAMNQFMDKVINTKGIKIADNLPAIEFYSDDEAQQKVKKISFDNSALGGSSHSTLIFEHKNNALYYGYGNNVTYANVVFANYIDEFIIEPVPSGSTYENCSGISITIKSKKDSSELIVINEVYFRN